MSFYGGRDMTLAKGISIGEVAKRTDLGVETIRFYEREGLIEEPPRKLSGYRQYPENVIERIRFIRRAKDLGFSLKEIRELLELQKNEAATAADVKKVTEAKVEELTQKMLELEKMKTTLNRLIDECAEGSAKACSLFTHLSSDSPLH